MRRPAPRPRRAGSAAPILAVSLLSAVLASGSTAALVTGLAGDRTAAATAGATRRPRPPSARSRPATADLTEVVAAATPSVVTITADTVAGGRFTPFSVPTTGVGSGIILSADGYILTNRHVVADSSSLTVELEDGSQYVGTIVDISSDEDLALIKIEATGLTPARIASSSALEVGETADRHRQPARDVHRDRDQGHRLRASTGRSPSPTRRPAGPRP